MCVVLDQSINARVDGQNLAPRKVFVLHSMLLYRKSQSGQGGSSPARQPEKEKKKERAEGINPCFLKEGKRRKEEQKKKKF
jgi:hypothetical protein